MRGSDVITGWAAEGTENIWETTVTSTVNDLFHDGTQGTKRTSIVACVAEGDWYYTGTTLYLYAPGDPDTQYTSPGVEAVVRGNCMYNTKKYIECYGNGADLGQAYDRIIYWNGPTGDRITGCVFDNFYVHDSKYGQNISGSVGISFIDCAETTISRCEVDRVAWNGIQFTVWSRDEAAFTGNVVEECIVHDVQHNGYDMHMISSRSPMTGLIVRHCVAYDNDLEGIFFYNEGATAAYAMSEWKCYGNLAYGNGRNGISADRVGGGANHDGCVIYNNTCYGNGAIDAGAGIKARCTDSDIRNNICFENNVDGDATYEMEIHADVGTANTVDYNCAYNSVDTVIYRHDGSGYTHSAYQGLGYQTNGLNTDPLCVNPSNGDFTLQGTSPCIGAADDTIGAEYADILHPESTWPDGVVTADHDKY